MLMTKKQFNDFQDDVLEYLDLILCDYTTEEFFTYDYSGTVIKDYIADHRCYDFVQILLAYGFACIEPEVQDEYKEVYLRHFLRLYHYMEQHPRIKSLYEEITITKS